MVDSGCDGATETLSTRRGPPGPGRRSRPPVARDAKLVAGPHRGLHRRTVRRDSEDDPVLLFHDRSDPELSFGHGLDHRFELLVAPQIGLWLRRDPADRLAKLIKKRRGSPQYRTEQCGRDADRDQDNEYPDDELKSPDRDESLDWLLH